MADCHPTSIDPRMNYRKTPAPSDAALLAELREITSYNEVTGEFFWVKPRGSVAKAWIGRKVGGESGRGYLAMNLLGHRFPMHRLVWLWHHGELPKGMLDHVNGDRQDNRISNLRAVTSVQNAWNRAVKTGSLGTGVSKTPAGKFNARIQMPDGDKAYLGTFETAAEASAAYIGAATVLHGDFAANKRRMKAA